MRAAWPRRARARFALAAQSSRQVANCSFLFQSRFFRPEALRADGPGGQHDVRVRVLALPAVVGEIGHHALVNKGALRVVAHQRAAVRRPQLAGNRHADLAGDLRILPALGRFDRVPQPRAVLRPRGRLSRGQNFGPSRSSRWR